MIFDFSLFRKWFSPKPRFILLFTEQEVSLFFFSPVQQPSLTCLTRAPLEAAPHYLSSFFSEAPHVPIDIFHDTPDQMLKMEKIPPRLHGLDAHRWVNHKRRSLTEEAAFSGLYRYRQKSKDVLFASFQISPLLSPWFQELKNFSNPPQGVYAFALEQVSVYQKLHQALTPLKAPWLLCVHFEASGRMRHTILHEGRFVLSRLFPPLTSSQNPLSNDESSVREIQGTLRYLMRQFSAPSLDIQAIFLGENFQSEGIKAIFEKEFWVLSLQKSAALLNMNPAPLDFEHIFLSAFYHLPQGLFLRLCPPPNSKKGLRFSFQKGNWIPVWLSGLSLWLGSGFCLMEARALQEKISFFQNQLKIVKRKSEVVRQELTAHPISADEIRHVLSLQKDLNASFEPPLKVMEKLIPVLGEKIRLRHLDWQPGLLSQFSNTLTIEAYPVSETLSQKQLIQLFDNFLDRLQETFPKSVLDILHAPYTTYQTQLLTGGLHDEALPADPTCIVKISW